MDIVSPVRLLLIAALATASLTLLADARADASSSDKAPELSPAELIESMSTALRTLNYIGTFVHAQGAKLTSMRILHSSNAKGEFERLTALDGEAREVIRSNSLVTCIWPGSESVVVSKSKPRDLLPTIDANLASNLHYSFTLGEPDRVAGRLTHVINVVPGDSYRYGYRFWIDADNHMLLRSMLLDARDQPLEQVIFTEINYPDSIDISLFDVLGADREAKKLSWLEPKAELASSKLTSEKGDQAQADRVQFTSLPHGYRKVSETYNSMPIRSGPVSHVMLTDGMASVSVYVEYVGPEGQRDVSLGLSRMGALNAYGLGTDKALITAVGEVPEDTVKAIAAAVTVVE